METYSPELINAGFIERLDTRDGQSKTAAASLTYIKDRLREASFTDMIIPNERVVRGDLQRSTEHDTLVKIVDIEPGSRAMPLNFRGLPTASYVNGKRYAIGFFTISSEKFEIVEQELMAYEMPITRIIEENSLKDMVEIKDREFLIHVDACVDAMQEEGNSGSIPFTAANVTNGTALAVSKIKGELARQTSDTGYSPLAIQRPPVRPRKPRAQLAHRLANLRMCLSLAHVVSLRRPSAFVISLSVRQGIRSAPATDQARPWPEPEAPHTSAAASRDISPDT